MQDTGVKRYSVLFVLFIVLIVFVSLYVDNLLTAIEFIRTPKASTKSLSATSSSLSRIDKPGRSVSEGSRQCSHSERTAHLQNYCKHQYGTDIYSQALDNRTSLEDLQRMLATSIIDDKHKIIFCSSAKVGSTSFKHLFIYHTDKYIQQYGTERVIIPNVHARWHSFGLRHSKQFSLEELQYRLKHYHKVVSVRHPLVRVYSMFRDKLHTPRAEGKCPVYQNVIGRRIIQLYRGPLQGADEICPLSTTFAEFMRYYASSVHRLSTDVHLRPYDRCFPCHIQYDQVLKLETSADDQLYLTENFFQLNKTGIHINNKSGETWKKLLREGFETKVTAYANVSQSDYEKVAPLYEEDQIRFGYSSKFDQGSGLTATCRIPTEDGTCC